MERDPHQLIEGILLTCYAVERRAGLPLRAGRDGAGAGAPRPGPERRLRHGLRRQGHPRHAASASTSRCTGAPAPTSWARRRRSSRASRASGACPGSSPRSSRRPRACTCSRRSSTTSRRCPTCRGSSPTAATPSASSARRRRPGMRMFAVSGHVNRPGVFEVPNGVTTFRELFDAPEYGGGIRDGRKLKAFIPGGASAPWFFEEHLDLPLDKPTRRQGRLHARLGRHRRHGRDDRRREGRLAGRALLRPRVVRQVHPVPRGHDLAGAHPRAASSTGSGRPEDLDLLLDVCDNISPGDPVAAPPDDHLPARSVGRVADHVGLPRFRDEFEAYIDHGAPRRRRRVPRAGPMSDATPSGAARQDHGVHHRRRPGARGRPGELVIDAAERTGRLHAPVLLPPRGWLGRHVPAVPRGGRTGRGTGARRRLHDAGRSRAGGRHRRATVKKAQEGVLEFLLDQPPARLPGVRQGWRVPAAGPDHRYGPGESRFVEEKRHFEKPIPISDARLPRPGALHPLRPLHPVRRGRGRRPAHLLHQPGQRRRRSTRSRTTRSRPTSAATRSRSARSGALTAGPYRFRARPWDLEQTETTCTTCSVGCRVAVQSCRNECCATRGSTATRSTGAGCATRAASTSRPSTTPSGWRAAGPPGRRAGRRPAGPRPSSRGRPAKAALADGGPSSVAVIGGARGTNEDAYAWAQAGQGVVGTDNVDAQLDDGLDPTVLGLAPATIDEACGGDDRRPPRPRPQGGAARPLPPRRATPRRRSGASAILELARRPRASTPYDVALRALRARRRPGRRAVPTLAVGRRWPSQLGRRRWPVVVISVRADLAEPQAVRPIRQALRGNVHGALDRRLAPGSCPVLRRGNVRGALAGAGVSPGRGRSGHRRDPRRGRRRAHRLPRPARRRPAVRRARRATLARRGARRRRGTVIAVDTHLTGSAGAADLVLPAAAFAEKAGTTTNLEGRVSRAQPEGHRRRHRPGPTGSSPPSWRCRSGPTSASARSRRCMSQLVAAVPALAPASATALAADRDGVLLAVAPTTLADVTTRHLTRALSSYDCVSWSAGRSTTRASPSSTSPSLAPLAPGGASARAPARPRPPRRHDRDRAEGVEPRAPRWCWRSRPMPGVARGHGLAAVQPAGLGRRRA